MPGQISTSTQAFDDETQNLDLVLTEEDTPALSAIISQYRADAARWKADAEEKGRTIETLKQVLANYLDKM